MARSLPAKEHSVYAVIEDSGRQFRVSQGDVLDVDLRELDENTDQIAFDRVLLVAGDGETKIGTPLVDGASVTAEVVDEVAGPKVYIHRWRRRKNSRRRTGHRQRYLRVQVTKIEA
jgi:large subunit ribosomal protein L21